MNKYHVKFTHQYERPQNSIDNQSSAIQYITETVDTEWELDVWVNVFAYIYANYEVIGNVEVTHIVWNQEEKTKGETEKWVNQFIKKR